MFLTFFKIQIKISPESQNTSYACRRGTNMQSSTLWVHIIMAPDLKLWMERRNDCTTNKQLQIPFFLIRKDFIFYTQFSCDERLGEALGGNIKYKKLKTWFPLRKSTKHFKKYISQKTSSILVGNCRVYQKVSWHSRIVLCLHLPGYHTDLI